MPHPFRRGIGAAPGRAARSAGQASAAGLLYLISHVLDREDGKLASRETPLVRRTASSPVATYSPRETSGRLQMNDPHGDAGAVTFTASHDGACDDAALLRRIGRGDEDGMAA